jgi:hypothetical protein
VENMLKDGPGYSRFRPVLFVHPARDGAEL